MIVVPLTKGYVAYIDDCDAQRVSYHSWCVQTGNAKPYAKSMINNESTLLHRFILGLTVYDPEVDHKDRNGLNCTRENMRLCTPTQNRMNTGLRRNNTTGYKGVSYHKANRKYTAYIAINGKRQYIGSYDDSISAALAYDQKAREHFGLFAHLNFPEVYSDAG